MSECVHDHVDSAYGVNAFKAFCLCSLTCLVNCARVRCHVRGQLSSFQSSVLHSLSIDDTEKPDQIWVQCEQSLISWVRCWRSALTPNLFLIRPISMHTHASYSQILLKLFKCVLGFFFLNGTGKSHIAFALGPSLLKCTISEMARQKSTSLNPT